MRCICFQLLSNCSHPDNRIIADSTYTACYYNTLDINTDDGNHILFWGTPHYSQRGTFHHPVASLRTSRKRVHDMNQNPVPSACFGKLSKRNLCDNNEASKSSEFAVFTRLPGYFAALSRHYIAPSDCAVTNEKSPAYGSVFCCLCKAVYVVAYRMERFAFFRLMWLAQNTFSLFVLANEIAILNVFV